MRRKNYDRWARQLFELVERAEFGHCKMHVSPCFSEKMRPGTRTK